jgi:glycerol-3-phosphate O-acyltransferase / dihydroxyacetone phosphate acyltransferase
MRAGLRRFLDGALSRLARLLLGLFFREVEVVGRERIPRGVPLLLIANHVNSLIDPILVMGYVGARPRILAKSTLWRHPVVAPLLILAGAVPVFRRQDDEDVSRNVDTFGRCRETLAAGGTVLLFPEGRSHNQPHQLPLKTGAARIALETEAKHGPLALHVVPVGITYEAKDRFGSRVLVFVGDPVPVAPFVDAYRAHARTAVRELTARLADELRTVTVSHGTWEEARLVDRAARVMADDAALSHRFSLRARVMREYFALRQSAPDRAASLEQAVAAYDRSLAELGIEEGDLDAPTALAPPGGRGLDLLLVVPGLVGVALNWLPFRLPGWISGRLSRTLDEPATTKLLGALAFFPLFWVLEATIAAALGGPLWGATLLVLAPATGYASLRAFARGRPWRGPRLDVHERLLAELRTQRARLREALASSTRPPAALG